MTIHHRLNSYRLLPFQFEELEIFPGCICNGTAHFDVDRHGDWSIWSIELFGYQGPDFVLNTKSEGVQAVFFNLICATLRNKYEDQILGNAREVA
jgi:hypothetical protein